jgi:hypothetical protein
MKKFILIIFICKQILETFSTGEYETGSSRKRKLENDNFQQNLSNSNENPLIENPLAHWFQEGMLMPMAASTDENVAHSSPTQKQILYQNLIRENSAAVINNMIGAEDKGKKPILSTNRHSKIIKNY